MPNTDNFRLLLNNQQVDVGDVKELGIKIDYMLEEPGDFMSKQGMEPINISLPATRQNDLIFNTFHNSHVQDLSPAFGGILTFTSGPVGSGYLVGDTITVLGGSSASIWVIDTVSGGGYPLTFTVITPGAGFIPGASYPTSTSGAGVGYIVTVLTVDSTGGSFREYMTCVIYVNGVVIFDGIALLTDCTFTEKPEYYDLVLYSENGQWVNDLQNVTLWDCVNPDTHTFDVATVKGSWSGYGTTPDHDFVYAPVRYSQPFDGTTLGYQGDNCVNIYHLRPSISLKRLLERGFNGIGFTISSQFFSTHYFKGLVLPWVWGDFYDINSQLVQGICFQAAGEVTTELPPVLALHSGLPIPFWSGTTSGVTAGSAGGSSWWNTTVNGGWNPGAYAGGLATLTNGILGVGGVYVFNGSGTSGAGHDWFRMDISNPPNGYDNFTLYSFDASTGTMIYDFNPPASLVGTMANVSATFIISLYAVITTFVGTEGVLAIECVQIPLVGPTITTCQSVLPSGGSRVGFGTYPDNSGFPTTPTVCNFTVPNMNPGDQIRFRVRALSSGGNITVGIFTGGYLNNNPAVIGVPDYAYNPVTQSFQFITPATIWSPLWSKLTMTGFLIQLGNDVNLQNYDAFRNYEFLDLLGGVIDMFNMEVSTDPINKVVTIEPMFGAALPTGETAAGYFSTTRVLDYSNKRDFSHGKGGRNTLFSSSNRQLDLSFKLDSSDNAQTIWGQRTKGIYLNQRTYTGGINQSGLNIDPGIKAAIPGAARYMLPNRFAKGNKQMNNRFFSAVMHVNFPQWTSISGVTPQLICMFPESATGEAAVTQSFTPKLAYYGGQRSIADVGGWIFIGDPASPDVPATASPMPMMCAVNYVEAVNAYPVLSYSDENINGVQVPGLMSKFYLRRFAIMRNGILQNINLRLNLNDICNWQHRQCIMMDGVIYALIQIEGYDPLTDDSNICVLWQVVSPQQIDIDNSYPSTDAIISQPLLLPNSYDLRYKSLMIYPTDLPQIS